MAGHTTLVNRGRLSHAFKFLIVIVWVSAAFSPLITPLQSAHAQDQLGAATGSNSSDDLNNDTSPGDPQASGVFKPLYQPPA